MNKEKLDLLLTNGAITQEEYNEALSKLQGNESEMQEKGQEETKQKEVNTFDEDRLEKLIQSKVDRLTSKLGREKAELQKELDKLRREKLSAEEVARLEIADQKKQLEEERAAYILERNKNFAKDSLLGANLCSKNDAVLKLTDLVMADDEEGITKKVKVLIDFCQALKIAEDEQRRISAGRNPGSGSNNNNINNPFSKQTFNLTEQMRILKENPELAKQLQATAN